MGPFIGFLFAKAPGLVRVVKEVGLLRRAVMGLRNNDMGFRKERIIGQTLSLGRAPSDGEMAGVARLLGGPTNQGQTEHSNLDNKG